MYNNFFALAYPVNCQIVDTGTLVNPHFTINSKIIFQNNILPYKAYNQRESRIENLKGNSKEYIPAIQQTL